MSAMRYVLNSTSIALCDLLPGAVTAWEGKRAVVVRTECRDLDGGHWVVVLNIGGKEQHVGGSGRAELPVFIDPYRVCSCHGAPWPCDVVWAEDVRRRQQYAALERCAACGNEKNLGPYRTVYWPEVIGRKYCRRVACVRAADRWEQDARREHQREWSERNAFAAQMNALAEGAT